MKQINMFGEEFENKIETQYTSKINIPNYEPRNQISNVDYSDIENYKLKCDIKYY